jgi:UDP-N-acetylglucosamine:LPS N-acetylglucosamine transferase
VIFTCGGTAGHVNPAIALAQFMHEKDPETQFLFVGAERGLEKDLIPKSGYDFKNRPHLQLSPVVQTGGDSAQSGVGLQSGPGAP